MKKMTLIKLIPSSILLLAMSILLPALAHAQAKDEATARFEKKIGLYEAGNLDAALAEFKAAYDLKPSYKILYNIATIYGEMGKNVLALETWKKYIAEGGAKLSAAKKKEAEEEIKHPEIKVLEETSTNVQF